MENKQIDAIDMTRKIRDSFARQLFGKTHTERIAFYRQQAAKMEKKIPSLIQLIRKAGESDSADYSILPINHESEPIVNLLREKQSPFKKTN
jgi:hypothetical protein